MMGGWSTSGKQSSKILYMQTVLTHDGGWHSGATGEDGFLNHVCQTGDGETHTGWGEKFEHPTKTWACATHKQFTMQAVAVAIAKGIEGAQREDWTAARIRLLQP
jgi:hypothetical protein